ncbi:Uncharacterised protein [Mycobacteroides abscessus subsp. abscessus]|nr:Uncharacterised protein [Mycobacteroides abscessus subsp. abscessus]
MAPELRTAKRSPASPSTKRRPPVAPNSAKLPTRTLPPSAGEPPPGERTTTVPPDIDFPTPSLHVPVCSRRRPSLQNAP